MKSYDDSNWCQIFAHWFKMVTIVAIVLVGFVTPVSAQFGDNTFELDGNIEQTTEYDDWEGPPTHAFATTGLLHDGDRMSIFTGGGSKDIRDVSFWKHTNGSVPDKDDIENAYAAAYNVGGALHVFLAGDRYSTDGSAQMGVWFFQQNISLDMENGTFNGVHTPGDILMLAEFIEGGRAADVKIYAWDPREKINLRLITAVASTHFVALSNTAPETSWSGNKYTPKGGITGGDFPPNSFFEGGIDLSEVLKIANNNVEVELPCFSSFLMETRSSHRVNAQLKDFVLGELNTCKLEITNMCRSSVVETENYVSLVNIFDYNITNVGFGTLDGVVLSSADAGYLGTVGPVETGSSLLGDYTYSSIENPASDTVTATYNDGEVSVTSNVAECPEVVQTLSLTLDKTCTTSLVAKDGYVALEVGYMIKVCNDQDGTLLKDVTISDPTAGVIMQNLGDLYPPDDPRVISGEFNDCTTVTDRYLSSSVSLEQENTVMVEASGSLKGEVSASKTATCNLCPEQTSSE